jgi:hypothetical protein
MKTNSWKDATKFDHYPDEPSEEEYWRLNSEYGREYGAYNCYDGTPPKLTSEEKERLRAYWGREREYDDLDVKLGLISQSKLDAIVGFIDQTPPVKDVESMELTWHWRSVSNANSQNGTRDQMRSGRLFTRTKNYMLFGVESFQEFMDHLHITDKEGVRDVYEALTAYYLGQSQSPGEFKMCFWVAKEDMKTRPGFWCISVDKFVSESRDIYFYGQTAGGQRMNVTFTKKTTINLRNMGCEE